MKIGIEVFSDLRQCTNYPMRVGLCLTKQYALAAVRIAALLDISFVSYSTIVLIYVASRRAVLA
jgi:hypothetical protein